jgi:hypothetical protein
VWLSIPFAFVTGLGVRTLVSTSGHASYVRGAMTMLLALAAYIGGWLLVAKIATARANTPTIRAAASAEKPAEAGNEAKDAAATNEPPVAPPKAVPRAEGATQPRAVAQQGFQSSWDYIWLAIAALIAYEMGRGSGMPTAPASPPVEPVPAGTHPDA